MRNALFASAFALSTSLVAPAHAVTLSIGDLMYTDFFLWNGQSGYIDGRTGGPALTWREILFDFDCTEYLAYYLTHVPELPAPPPTIVDPPPVIDPPPIDPPCVIGCGVVIPPTPTVPEPSTWLMMILGFGSLVLWRRPWLSPIRKRSST